MKDDDWTLLELAALGVDNDERVARFLEILTAGSVDWGGVLDAALRNKVLHLLAHALDQSQAHTAVPRFLAAHLRDALRLNRYRLDVYRREAVRISDALSRHGVRAAFTKGIVIESTIYGASGARFLSDIDLMIAPEDADAAWEAVEALGYRQGYYDWTSGEIRPPTRRERLSHKLNPDHLLPSTREIDDPFVPCVPLDIAFSLTWAQSEYQVPVPIALAKLAEVALPGGVGSVPSLSVEYEFLFTVLHLFREAWVEAWVALEQDVNLIKFVDVLRLWRHSEDSLTTDAFRRLLSEHGVEEPVAWVVAHLDEVFRTNLAVQLGIAEHATGVFLQSAGTAPGSGQTRSWHGNMRSRLQSTDNRAAFGDRMDGNRE